MSAPKQVSLFGDMADMNVLGAETRTTKVDGAAAGRALRDVQAPDAPDAPAAPPQPPPDAPGPEHGGTPSHAVAGRELRALTPAQLVRDMPKPWRIITLFPGGREVWWTDHGPSAIAAQEQGIPVFVTTNEGHELLAVAEAVAQGRAWPDDLQDWCERKLAELDHWADYWRLSRAFALGGAKGLTRQAPLTPAEEAWFAGELCPEDAHLLDAHPEPRAVTVVDVFDQLGLTVVEAR